MALAQGETARFEQVLAQYEHAPGVTRERIYIETLETVYKNSRKVLIDTKGGNSMMYLPLDKLVAPAGAVSTPAPGDALSLPQVRAPDNALPPEDPTRIRGVR